MVCGGRGSGSLSPSPSHSQAARSTVTRVQQGGDLGEHKSFSGRTGNGGSLTSPGRPASSTPVLPAPSQVPPSLSHSAAQATTFSSGVPAIALSTGPHFSHHPTSFPPGLASSLPQLNCRSPEELFRRSSPPPEWAPIIQGVSFRESMTMRTCPASLLTGFSWEGQEGRDLPLSSPLVSSGSRDLLTSEWGL